MDKAKGKRIFGITLIITSLCSLYFVPWLLLKAVILPLPDTVGEQLEQALGHGFDGVVVYAEQAGESPQYFTAGWHCKETKQEARPDALFKIASINKLYAAVALSKLVAAERLSLDKTLADYMPELVGRIEYADKINLRMLVQHRSGIPNFTDAPNFWSEPTKTFESSLALILDQEANFKPGKSYEYCNTNYLLLSKIMDNELGYDNFQFIQTEILDPLKLKHTYASLHEVDMDSIMSGYHIGYPYDLKAENHGMLATAQDVGVFLRALNDGSVFGPGEAEIYASIYEYEHAGWVPGYQSFATYHEELDLVLVSFYSTTDAKLYNWNLSEIVNRRIVRILKRQQQ